MATLLGSLLVSLGLESGEFKSGLDAAEKQMQKSARNIQRIGDRMARTGRNLSIAVTAPLAALGVASFNAASDAAELQSAFNQTFGSMASDMTAWAEATGDAMGRSTQEIQNAANTFGIFFNQAAPTRQAAADLSKEFSILAQDLSSFFNVDPTVALQKLRSGLSGESEPLRDFGVFLNEAAVEAKAFELGIATVGSELTEQNKIMARAALIMEATVSAQGDVARTSDGTANRVRRARAAFEELQVTIGQKLIPALTPLIERITNLLNGFNNLSPGVQTAIVTFGALAAAIGPVMYIMGNLISIMGPMIAGIKSIVTVAISATAASGSLAVGLTALRAALISLTISLAPYLVALALIAGAVYLVIQRNNQAARASAEYREQQEKLRQIQERVADATREVATTTGQARREAIANARALRQETAEYLANARAALVAARAKASVALNDARQARNLARSQGPELSQRPGRERSNAIANREANRALEQAMLDVAVATRNAFEAERQLAALNRIINAPAPEAPTGLGAGSTGGGRSGPSAEEIQRRFEDELISYGQQSLSAMQQVATSAEERAELESRSVEWARRQTLDSIALDEDYTDAQKAELALAVESVAEQERAAIRFRERAELEQQRDDLLRVEFENERELLALQADIAGTEAERKRLALESLALEQEYRRNQLEMVVASSVASDAEKARAQAILDSLAAIEAGERESVSQANETTVERYLRDINKSPEQINEAIDRIKINGLETLNDALVDSIVNFKSLADVASSVVKSIIADLLRLQIQQAIIRPLAMAMGLGGGIPGFANGTSFAPGGLALVGERGPELVNLPRGSQVFPNGQTERMMGGGASGDLQIRLGPGLEAEWLRKSAGQTVQIIQAAGPEMIGRASAQSRRDAARPIMPGGATG